MKMDLRESRLLRTVEPGPDQPPLLDVDGLSLEFRTRSGTVHALEDVSFQVARGETVGIVGESGSGKSVLCYALMGLSLIHI